MLAKLSLFATFAVLILTGCSPNLRPTPASTAAVSFAGTWTLDKARSDRVDEELGLTLRAANEKQAKKAKSRRMPGPEFGDFPESSPPQGDQAAGPPYEPWWLREQKRLEEELVAAIKPPESLRIVQTQGRVEIISMAGGAWRVFDPARSSTLVTDYATLRIESGWQGNVFVVWSSDGAAKLSITERYSLDSKGDLDERLVIEVPNAKTQNYHVIYKRAE